MGGSILTIVVIMLSYFNFDALSATGAYDGTAMLLHDFLNRRNITCVIVQDLFDCI